MANLNPAIVAGVTAALAAAGANPSVSVTPDQAKAATPAVIDALTANPIVINATNSEPWYQSRVAWGSIVAIAAPLVGLIIRQDIDAGTQSQLVTILTAAGGAAGGAYALYARLFGKGKAPIGRTVA